MMLNILLLCNKPQTGNDANTIVDHIEAVEHYSEHKIWLCSLIGDLPGTLNLEKFDAVIIHYSLSILTNHYLSLKAKQQIRDFKGLKLIFVQDEYRQIDVLIHQLAFLKVDVFFTCFPEEEIEKIYPKERLPELSKYTNLTGYIPERLTQIIHQQPMTSRPIHVGYRGRKLPFWYGALAYEKWNIVDKWLEQVTDTELQVDLSYQDNKRIYGAQWIHFLSSCKTTLGVESGASVMDFTGELEKVIDFHQLRYPHDSFDKVQKAYLLPHEGKYKLNQISPRCFEAIALKTVLVLYEGEYSGILIPGRHYIMLKKDFSNIKDVVSYIKDDNFLERMANIAYNEIALNPLYSYASFIKHLDKVIATEFVLRDKLKNRSYYSHDEFKQVIARLGFKGLCVKKIMKIYQKLPLKGRLLIRSVVRPKVLMRYITQLFFRLTGFYQK